MEIVLIRHTKVASNGVCYGFSDVDVADSFEIEKNEILLKNDFSGIKVISSPLNRCTKLASKISESYKTDHRLKELNFGDWEMQKWDEISDPEFDTWMNNYINYKCPNGESLLDMKSRVEEFYLELISSDLEKVVIVTHAGVIRLFYHLIKGVPLDQIFNLKIGYGDTLTFLI